MKALILFFFCSLSFAAETYTSVTVSKGIIFAGVKSKTGKNESVPSLLQVIGESAVRVKLPKEQDGREIVALLPFDQSVFVVTQSTEEQGDDPLISIFDSSKKTWKAIGTVNCKSFDQIKTNKERIEFQCETTTESGESKKTISFIALEKAFEKELTISFPQVHSMEGDLRAELQGPPFSWKKMKVNNKEKTRFFDLEKISKVKK